MSTDLIAVLSEGAFSEQILDLAAFLSRSLPEAERDDFIAPLRDDAVAADEDAAAQSAIVERVVGSVKGLGEGSDRELEGAYNLLTALILSVFANEDAKRTQLLSALCAAVSKDAGASASGLDRSAVKYRILSNIFNALPPTSSTRLSVFKALLEVASAHDELDYLSDALSSIPAWLSTWDVSTAEKASLLSSLVDKLSGADAPVRAFEFLQTYLRFLDPAAPEAKEAAERTIATALRLPKVWEFDQLLQIQAVQSAKGTPAFELLRIFVGGDAKQYQSWLSSNAAEVKRLELDADQLDRKMRLLDLASLCSRSVSREVPYSEIASVLSISESQVESWVIDVIRAGLVSGKLSQVNSSFRVYRSTYRSFGKEQWQLLESRLVQWQASIDSILATIADSRNGGGDAQGNGQQQQQVTV